METSDRFLCWHRPFWSVLTRRRIRQIDSELKELGHVRMRRWS